MNFRIAIAGAGLTSGGIHAASRLPSGSSTEFADPAESEKRAKAIVQAATHFKDPKVLLEVSEDLAGAMKGLAVSTLDEAHLLQTRGW